MKISVMIGAVYIALFVGCASHSSMRKKSSKISSGMSVTKVTELMGAPQNRQFNGKYEAWQYCTTDYSGLRSDLYTLIWVYDKEVIGLETYNNYEMGTCDSFFKTIKWENAPDITVEIRNR